MIKCEVCGKEFQTSQGLASHKAIVHEGKVRGGMSRLINPNKALEDKAVSILNLAIGDLCEGCQGKIKDKLLPSETLVRLIGKPSASPQQQQSGSWWDAKPAAEEPSKGGSGWLWLILIGLLLLSQSKTEPGTISGLFHKS